MPLATTGQRLTKLTEPRRYLLRTAKHRAKSKGIECSITIDDFEIPDRCPVLDIPLVMNRGKAKGRGKGCPTSNSPSLDRINPSLGYVKGNVAVISHKANAMKQNADSSELLKFALWVSKHLGEENERHSK